MEDLSRCNLPNHKSCELGVHGSLLSWRTPQNHISLPFTRLCLPRTLSKRYYRWTAVCVGATSSFNCPLKLLSAHAGLLCRTQVYPLGTNLHCEYVQKTTCLPQCRQILTLARTSAVLREEMVNLIWHKKNQECLGVQSYLKFSLAL